MADLSMRTVAREIPTITPPSFPSHIAARVAAAWQGNRPADPQLPIPGPRGPVDLDAARLRMETEAAYALRDRQLAETVRAEIAGVAA